MRATEKDVQALTPQHRVVWKIPEAPREYEVGLYVDRLGTLRTDAGKIVRWRDGTVPGHALNCIVRIIEPPLVPRVGMVIEKPVVSLRRLVCVSPDRWFGYAPEFRTELRWYTDADARALVGTHGWVVAVEASEEGS